MKEAKRDKSRNESLPGRPGNQDVGSEWLKIVFSGTFLDVNHFSGIVKSSNLLLRHPNTSVDVVGGLQEARSDKSRNESLKGRSETMILAQHRVFWHVSGRK